MYANHDESKHKNKSKCQYYLTWNGIFYTYIHIYFLFFYITFAKGEHFEARKEKNEKKMKTVI